jgi:hypothetical protein
MMLGMEIINKTEFTVLIVEDRDGYARWRLTRWVRTPDASPPGHSEVITDGSAESAGMAKGHAERAAQTWLATHLPQTVTFRVE